MEIQTVKDIGENYLLNNFLSVPKSEANRHYAMIQEWIAEGNTVEPEFTTEELAEKQSAQAKLEAEKLRDEAMFEGADYNGYQISFTKDDGDGMLQVKAGFELGLTATNIKFANGTILPMTATDFPAFALWFVSKRNEFFM